jgi:hypothetical protein
VALRPQLTTLPMTTWNSISFTVESSGALSIVTREDVDKGHALECCYTISLDDSVSVRIRETHQSAYNVEADRDLAGALSDVPPPAVQEALRWLREAIAGARVGSALRAALELHLGHLEPPPPR